MQTELQIAKSLLSPPGDTIQETIRHYGITITELSEKTGLSVQSVNDLIEGIEPITVQIANQLGKVLKIPASFWINRENGYRLELQKNLDNRATQKYGKY